MRCHGRTLADVRRRGRTTLMAPPTIGTPVTIRYPTDVLAALDQRAEAEGISRAELLRRIAARYIEETT